MIPSTFTQITVTATLAIGYIRQVPNTKPQPGGHNPLANFKCLDIINAAQSDGLTLDFDVPAN